MEALASSTYAFAKDVVINPWAIGIGTAVISGLVLYYGFGIGRKERATPALKTSQPFTFKVAEEEVTFEEKMRSLGMDVVKVHAHDHVVGVSAEYAWIQKNYPGSKTLVQSLIEEELTNGRGEKRKVKFDQINIELKNGRTKSIYFDISSFFSGSGHSSLDSEYARKKIKGIYSLE